MIARIDLFNKKDGVSFDTFRKHLNDHKVNMSQMSGFQKYAQNYVVESTQPSGLGNKDYPRSSEKVDAFSKIWFDDQSSAEKALSSNAINALNNNDDLGKLKSVVTKQNIVIPTAQEKGIYKMMQILRRPADVSPEKFEYEWCKVHAEMVPHTLPGALGYTQNLVINRSISGKFVPHEELPIDGIVEFWFKDKESMDAAFSAPTAIKAIDHARVFIDTISTFTIESK
ncbi:EthD domain-containing protein [Peribacillus simplex]|uniref:EthD domain-containing protein n=1 Tax=Peribacillus simplex TaxID=1478 RepID=UPI0037FEF313